MPSTPLLPKNQAQLAQSITDDTWVVACLCAAWCDVCSSYRSGFDKLADEHTDKVFVWVDIEDRSDLVGDFDVENFPTLVIQRGDDVLFYGTTMPDPHIADRLLKSYQSNTPVELKAQTCNSDQHRDWQRERNLRKVLS